MGNVPSEPVVNSENSIEEGAVNVSVGNNTWIVSTFKFFSTLKF